MPGQVGGIHLEYEAEAWKRLAAGCSCGLCGEGYLSPRMSFKLIQQALFINVSFEGELVCGGLRPLDLQSHFRL